MWVMRESDSGAARNGEVKAVTNHCKNIIQKKNHMCRSHWELTFLKHVEKCLFEQGAALPRSLSLISVLV